MLKFAYLRFEHFSISWIHFPICINYIGFGWILVHRRRLLFKSKSWSVEMWRVIWEKNFGYL